MHIDLFSKSPMKVWLCSKYICRCLSNFVLDVIWFRNSNTFLLIPQIWCFTPECTAPIVWNVIRILGLSDRTFLKCYLRSCLYWSGSEGTFNPIFPADSCRPMWNGLCYSSSFSAGGECWWGLGCVSKLPPGALKCHFLWSNLPWLSPFIHGESWRESARGEPERLCV